MADSSDPYFLHHSDNPGLVLVSKTLNGDNYSGWKRAMTLALNSKNKLGFIDGSITVPNKETNPDTHSSWSRCNDMVHSWLLNTLDPEIADSVIYYPTAHEVWEDLRERYSQKNAPRIFEIQRDIASFRQNQLSVSAYYTKLKGFWDELAALDPTQGTHTDQQKLMQFLMGLDETFQAVRGQILLMSPLPTVRQAFASIVQEEKQRLLGARTALTEPTSAAAMAVRQSAANPSRRSNQRDQAVTREFQSPINSERRTGERSNFSGPNFGAENFERTAIRRNNSEKRRPHCTHCDQMGHWIQTCYELHGYPAGHPKAGNNSINSGQKRNHFNKTVNNVTNSGPSVSLSENQLQQLLSLLDKQHEPSSPKANVVREAGSGNEEDDWFG
ncbi:hypothetical protein LguiB_030760 [Lonicera macranthoides]